MRPRPTDTVCPEAEGSRQCKGDEAEVRAVRETCYSGDHKAPDGKKPEKIKSSDLFAAQPETTNVETTKRCQDQRPRKSEDHR